MRATDKVERVIREAFEDVALLIGGTAALHHLRDALVWSLLRRLDGVRKRTLARLPRERLPAPTGPDRSHPAVEEFLRSNRIDQRSADVPANSRKVGGR